MSFAYFLSFGRFSMNRRQFLAAAGGTAAALCFGKQAAGAAGPVRPHIIYVLADDMGYGNISCLNPDSMIQTPNADGLAARGVVFTDAHSGCSVCTPTRYGILTGRYYWRNEIESSGRGNAPALIPPERLTVAALLKENGYRTVGIGKWHLGLNLVNREGKIAGIEDVDYEAPIKGGPVDLGFDYYFGIPASLDMSPYFYFENDRIVQAATERTSGDHGRNLRRAGPIAPDFKFEEVLPTCGRKAVECIDNHAGGKPLFMYLALTAPHTPVVPSAEFAGKSPLGAYGDFCVQVDAVLGDVVRALERNGMLEDTLLIFTSDNGIAPAVDPEEFKQMGHSGSYIYRGMKTDIFDGGHRIPFIAAWPGKIKAGTVCGKTVCLSDLMATAADICGDTLPPDAGEDSVSMLPALLGEDGPERPAVVHESANGSLAIREGKWKLLFCPGSGGKSHPTLKEAKAQGLPKAQLYDMEKDPGETENVQAEHPELVARLTKVVQTFIDNGRSTPGPKQEVRGRVKPWRTEYGQ